jgi:hypothetical protein
VVTITALISIAERVGANRIFKTEGRFHHPLGEPALTPEAERTWRHKLLRAAVEMLMLPIDKPTIKDITQLAVH